MTRYLWTRPFILLACAVGLALPSAPAWAQAPAFVFQDTSDASLAAYVYANDPFAPSDDEATAADGGFYSPFGFSGGVVDWGNTINIVAQSGMVKSSANPLVRLDGDGTGRVSIAWKGFNILDCDGTLEYSGRAESWVTAQIKLTLNNLVGGQDYTIFGRYSVRGRADGEHEAVLEDPEDAAISLDLDIAGSGVYQIYNFMIDNVLPTVPKAVAQVGGEQYVFTTPAGATSVEVDVYVSAEANSTFVYPEDDDLVVTFVRGTLTLSVEEQIPGVIISEVVDGDLSGGNPKYVEITNCGETDWTFDTDDVLKVYFNGSASAGASVDLAGITLAVGESIVIATDRYDGIAKYQDAYLGLDADVYVSNDFGNGNDVYSLEFGSVVHDTYGWIGVDGTGTDWEYTDSYAYSIPYRAPNSGVFDPLEWTFGGPGALDAAADPERNALLRANTSPGRHVCFGTVGVADDSDFDGDVDLNDLTVFSECFFGPDVIPAPSPPPTALECLYAFDTEPDSDIDVKDFAGFMTSFTTP